MLIELNVTNFRSFWQTQKLQMTANHSSELREQNSFKPPVKDLPNLLRSVVIYGPNASGKSNFIQAFFFMKQFVLESAKNQEGESIAAQPHIFNKSGTSRPSEFEVLFVADGIRYQYGFAVTTERVTHEWLLSYPQGRAQRWFERLYNEKNKEYDWFFGSKFTGSKKIWQEATRANALFLSSAIQLNNEQMKPVFYWFRHIMTIRSNDIIDRGLSVEQCQMDTGRNSILEFMNAADLSIDQIKCEKKELSLDQLPAYIPRELKNQILNDFQGKMTIQVSFGHKINETDQVAWLPIDQESDGTKKLFAYAGPWLEGLANGRVFIVDELDTSLHPLIVRFLLKLIHSPEINKNNAQLIFTTHDTSLLDLDILRRDQIWFMEKDKQNSSSLYPLSDFKPRKHELLEKGYLKGRYGALPFIGEVGF